MSRFAVMLLSLIITGPAFGGDVPIKRPEPPAPVAGQCAKNFALTKGKPLPTALVYQPSNPLLACSAVAVPLSDYADLLATESWAKAVASQYELDTKLMEAELDWYKKQLDQQLQPPPFLERPATQRWMGRLETLVTVAVVAVGLGAAYQYGSGGLK
jgi:hypothetical protein